MKVITEFEIDTTIAVLEGNDEQEMVQMVEMFQVEQPDLVAYIMGGDMPLFTAVEREIMLYLSLVIWKTLEVAHFGTDIKKIDASILKMEEESNWEVLDGEEDTPIFSEKIAPLYEGYDQEDLLAFVEDAIAESNGAFEKEAREPMFVMMKAVVDAFKFVLADAA